MRVIGYAMIFAYTKPIDINLLKRYQCQQHHQQTWFDKALFTNFPLGEFSECQR